MIRSVSIQNFRALRDVNVELRPLTVLVGVNDSGKTSFLEAVRLGHSSSPDRGNWWRGVDQPTIRLKNDEHMAFSGNVALYRLPSDGIPMSSLGVAESEIAGAPPLRADGGNVAALLDHLLRRDRQRFDRIEAELRRLVPGLESLSVKTPSLDSRAISLTIEQHMAMEGTQLSTGARMLFFFVALAFHPDPPHVALIEEPEGGVHPKRLKDIIDLLRQLTQGKLSGEPVQVILTTHSPYLLDHIRLPEDQVLVFRREDDGRRTATEANQEGLKTFLDEFMLGEVWFNQGEEGLLASHQ